MSVLLPNTLIPIQLAIINAKVGGPLLYNGNVNGASEKLMLQLACLAIIL